MPADTKSVTGFLILALELLGGGGVEVSAMPIDTRSITGFFFLLKNQEGVGSQGGKFAQGTRFVTGFLVFLMNLFWGWRVSCALRHQAFYS